MGFCIMFISSEEGKKVKDNGGLLWLFYNVHNIVTQHTLQLKPRHGQWITSGGLWEILNLDYIMSVVMVVGGWSSWQTVQCQGCLCWKVAYFRFLRKISYAVCACWKARHCASTCQSTIKFNSRGKKCLHRSKLWRITYVWWLFNVWLNSVVAVYCGN